MELREFGQTGLEVTRLGLGLAALGRPGYINLGHAKDVGRDKSVDAMRQNAHEVLDAAWAAGIRYYDAARSYGLAEEFLATWLKSRRIAPRLVTVGSKWGYTYTAGWQVEAPVHEIKDHSVDVLRRQHAESVSLLGGYLQLYQIHSATFESGVLDNAAVLGELARLRDGGLVIGLSLSGRQQAQTLARAMSALIDGRPLFGAVQATWNLLAQESGGVLAEASDAGMGVIVKEALANGRLTPRNTDPAFAGAMDILAAAAAELNTTIDAVALGAVLAQPWADVVLSGAARIEHLDSNVLAANISMSPAMLSELLSLAEEPGAYWARRSELAWN